MMTIRLTGFSLILLLVLGSSTGLALDRVKYEYLPPDRPCMFFIDEETGVKTNIPANPPCDIHTTRVEPGDTVDPELVEKYGVPFEPKQKKTETKSERTQ